MTELRPAVDLANNLWAALPPKIFDDDITPMQARTNLDAKDKTWYPKNNGPEHTLASGSTLSSKGGSFFSGKASVIYIWFLILLTIHIILAIVLAVLTLRLFKIYNLNRVLCERATYLATHRKPPLPPSEYAPSENDVRVKTRSAHSAVGKLAAAKKERKREKKEKIQAEEPDDSG